MLQGLRFGCGIPPAPIAATDHGVARRPLAGTRPPSLRQAGIQTITPYVAAAHTIKIKIKRIGSCSGRQARRYYSVWLGQLGLVRGVPAVETVQLRIVDVFVGRGTRRGVAA